MLGARARATLAALGVRLHRTGAPLATTPGTLLVANHVSWLDALALLSSAPVRLLAKREVATWPLVGPLTTRAGTLYIDRTAFRDLPRAVATLAAALRSGQHIALFPEGTTRCSAPAGTFRRATFQAAIDAGAPVQPVTLTYRQHGHPTTAPAYVGDTAFLTSLRHVAHAADLTVTLHAHPPIPSHHHTRRTLATAAQHTVHPPTPPATLAPVPPRLRSSGDRAPLS
ncbi:lysophospholipid acyltransferase family protein [Streptomyces marinisediminis]|uniref:lysophospholipid acyltransferase family protein n=1 Tax=Streptomyces TaxID=1883 RepID=UPI003A4C72AA